MIRHRIHLVSLFVLIGLSLLLHTTPASYAQSSDTSELVTWSCTGSPCPWGSTLSNHALVWPDHLTPTTTRLGYTTSAGVYLPANVAAGMTLTVTTGTAHVYAGLPDAPAHRLLVSLTTDQTTVLTDLAAGEVVSVQGPAAFSATVTWAAATTPTATAVATETASPDTTATVSTTTATTSPQPSDTSELVTWSCTGSPCPWGTTLSNHALVWPASMEPVSTRLGYTTSAGVYLPANVAAGMTLTVTTGTATVYAGLPEAPSHRLVTTLSVGETTVLTDLAAGEVVSVQGPAAFTYAFTLAPPPTATATAVTTATVPTDATATTTATPVATATPTVAATDTVPTDTTASQLVTWSCTGSPCPWGTTLSNHALVWPDHLTPTTTRLGYTTSAEIYLPANVAAGMTLTVTTGTAHVYAGLPNASSHRLLASLTTDQTTVLTDLAAGEVVSVQGPAAFTYAFTLAPPPTATATAVTTATVPTDATATTTATPVATATPEACDDPMTCDPVSAVIAHWHCNTPDCTYSDWIGAAITWPEWSAYEDNGRTGWASRTVYSADGEKLYPYMGAWATGCQVNVISGTVLIIEWERGTNVWRETYLEPGESHTIALTSPENGAMIEGPDYSPGFTVSLENCNPQVIEKTPTN